MCDNIDVLLADEAGLEGEYDIGAEDEEALLEDNFDDQNLVSSSNRNYYVSREELEEEELDHEPEEPEETEESQDLDVNVSDLPDEDFDDARKTSNPREKRNTKFVSERILPINTSYDGLQNTNTYKKPIGKPQQQQSINNRNKNFNNRGGRGRGFRARGRGNISSRPEAKKVLINPHFQGHTHFNIQARSPWNNNTNIGARAQPWSQQRMQPTQYMQSSIQQFQQQVRNQGYPYMQQQHQIDFHQETDRMPPQQRASVHLRIGKAPPILNQSLGVNLTAAQPQFIDQQPPQHTYQTPPQLICKPPPQHTYEPPPQVYQLPALNNPQGMLVQQPLYNQPPPNQQQATFVTNNQYPPTMASPPQAASTFAQQPQQQLFSSPPPGYQFNQSMHAQTGCYEHQQQTQHQNVYGPPQEHGSFEFQPPPQVPQQRHVQDVHYQQQQQQLGYQQHLQEQRRAPPNYHSEFQLPNCDIEFNSQHFNPPQNSQQIKQPVQYQQARRVYVPRPNIQHRLEPADHKQTSRNVLKQDGRFVKRTVYINRGGGSLVTRVARGNVTIRGNGVISPGKRRFPPPQRGVGQRRRRTDFVNMHDTPMVDSTTTHCTGLNTAAVSVTNPAEIEEDEETRQYRQKIENQKRIREKILAQKEERRRQAVLNKDLANIAPPAELVATVISEQSPIKTIISQPQTTSSSALNNIKRRVINRVNTSACNNRIVTQTQAQTVQAVIAVDKSEISSFLTNRRIIAKDQSLPDTAIVVVSNLSAGTSEVKLRKLCQGVGNVQKLEMSPSQRQATIEFKSIASAHAFFKKYQRYMVDLSMINVVLKI